MTCDGVIARLAAFLALELDPATERDVRLHLAGCRTCRASAVALDPLQAVALALAGTPGPSDDTFISEVMAGVHQRRVERRLPASRRWWLAAAAAVLVVVGGGTLAVRLRVPATPTSVAERPGAEAAAVEPAFVQVEGEGVRLYQVHPTTPEGRSWRVAFVVDPRLEL